MLIAQRIELYPTPKQAEFFERACGSRRHAFNQLLAHFKQDGVKFSKKACYDQYCKIREEFPWYAEISRRITFNACADLENAFKHFFRRCKLGQNPGFPRFKKRGIGDSFSFRESGVWKLEGKKIKLQKFDSWIKMARGLHFKGKLKQITISRIPSGKWYASILVDSDEYWKRSGVGSVGVDLGVSSLATLSDGTKIEANQHLKKSLKKLKKYQRKLSRKVKGSNRRAKAKLKVARIHNRVSNQRKDSIHRLTDKLTRENSLICIEDLNVAGMVKNRKLARAISDAGFGEFRRQIEYKAQMRGAKVVVVDRFFPSSKTCSGCGNVKEKLMLSERTYECDQCGLVIDRDHNAALNILRNGEQSLGATEATQKVAEKRAQEECKTGSLATPLTARTEGDARPLDQDPSLRMCSIRTEGPGRQLTLF